MNNTDCVYVIVMRDGTFYMEGGSDEYSGILTGTKLHQASFMSKYIAESTATLVRRFGRECEVARVILTLDPEIEY